ncbi:MAG: hypothetical protein ACREVC_12630 [Burkholderiales bacterium]
MNRARALIFFACLCAPAASMAQTAAAPTQAQARELSNYLKSRAADLNRTSGHLTAMFQASANSATPDTVQQRYSDTLWIGMVLETSHVALKSIDDLVLSALLYSVMKCEFDRRVARLTLLEQVKEYIDYVDGPGADMDGEIVGLSVPAESLESMKLRDTIQEIRDRLSKFAPPAAKATGD